MFTVRIQTNTVGDDLTIAWDVNRSGKNFMAGSNTFNNMKPEGLKLVRGLYESALNGLGVPCEVKEHGKDVTIKYTGLSEPQFLAVEAACNAVLCQLNASRIALLK